MCLAVFYNAQPRVPIYHDFLYYFGSLRIYIVSRSPIKPVNDYPVMIYSTSVTIVIISPHMKESNWIDWEIELI